MKIWQFSALTAAAFAGCFGGAWLATRPMTAHAQYRMNPQQQIQMQDILFVPSGGLRMVNENGRVLGMIGERNGSGFIVLNSPTGPSVNLYGGAGGRLEAGVGQGAAVFKLENGNMGMEFTATNANVTAQIGNTGSPGVQMTANGNGGEVKVNGRSNVMAARMIAQAAGGRVEIANQRGQTLLELLADGNGGMVTATGATPGTAASVSGQGKFTLTKDGQVAWTVPSGGEDD